MTRQRERCRHRHDYADSIGVRQYNGDSHVFFTTEIRRCVHCDAWLPLGPAADDSEAVVQEMAAAAIASDWDSFNEDHRGPVSMGASDMAEQYLDVCIPERDAGRPGRRRDVFELEIGMLAREIATHDTEGS